MPPEILSFLQIQAFIQPDAQGQSVTQQESTGAIDGAFDALIAEYANDKGTTQSQTDANIFPDITNSQTTHTPQPQETVTAQISSQSLRLGRGFSGSVMGLLVGEESANAESVHIEARQPERDNLSAWRNLFADVKRGIDFPVRKVENFASQNDFDEGVVTVEESQSPEAVRDEATAHEAMRQESTQEPPQATVQDSPHAMTQKTDTQNFPVVDTQRPEAVIPDSARPQSLQPQQEAVQPKETESATPDLAVANAQKPEIVMPASTKPQASQSPQDPAQPQEAESTTPDLPVVDTQRPEAVIPDSARPQSPQESAQHTETETTTPDLPVVDAQKPEAVIPDSIKPQSPQAPVQPREAETTTPDLPVADTQRPETVMPDTAKPQSPQPPQAPTQPQETESTTPDLSVIDSQKLEAVMPDSMKPQSPQPPQESIQPQETETTTPDLPVIDTQRPQTVIPDSTEPQSPQEPSADPVKKPDSQQTGAQPSASEPKKPAVKPHVITRTASHEAATTEPERSESPETTRPITHQQAPAPEITTPNYDYEPHEVPASYNTPTITLEHSAQDYGIPASDTARNITPEYDDSDTPAIHADIPDANIIMAGVAQVQPVQTETLPEAPAEAPQTVRPSRVQPQTQHKTQTMTHEATPEIPDSQPESPRTQSQTQPGHEETESTITPQPAQNTGSDSGNDGTIPQERVPSSAARISRTATQTDRTESRNVTRNDTRKTEVLSDFQSFFDSATRAKHTASRVNTRPLSLRTDTYTASESQPQSHTLRNGIVNTVRFIRTDGVRKANIVVDPPALGRITVELTSSSSGVEASVKVASEQIRQIVQDQITQLRDNLLQQGVQVSEFTVDVQQDNTGQGQDSGSQNQQNSYTYTASDDDDDTENFRVDLEEGLLYWVA